MKKGDFLYQQYINILKEELRPAMGCTEPIAMAYAGAKARQILGAKPDKVRLFVSGNIIKNVKSVVVPNTGGLHGMAAAICAGIVAGDADRELQVISNVPKEKHREIKEYMQTLDLDIQPAYSDLVLTSMCSNMQEVMLSGCGSSIIIPTLFSSRRTGKSCWSFP